VTPSAPALPEARVLAACSRFGLPESGPFQNLAGDVGQRRYVRLRTWADATVVLVLYPEPSSPAQERWRRIGDALGREGLRVPALLDDDPGSGTALVEDLGDRDLAAELREATPGERGRLIEEAEELLAPLRGMSREAALLNPPFDAAFSLRSSRIRAAGRSRPTARARSPRSGPPGGRSSRRASPGRRRTPRGPAGSSRRTAITTRTT